MKEKRDSSLTRSSVKGILPVQGEQGSDLLKKLELSSHLVPDGLMYESSHCLED